MNRSKQSKQQKEQQLQRVREIFQQFDEDGNGTIDKMEFVKGMGNYFNINPQDNKEITKMFLVIFKMCDKARWFKGSDGVLDFNEFVRIVDAFPEIEKDSNSNTLLGTTLFNIIDGNRSGKISQSEMKNFLKHFNYNKKDVRDFMQALDEDGSKKIELNEFLKWFKSFDSVQVDDNVPEDNYEDYD